MVQTTKVPAAAGSRSEPDPSAIARAVAAFQAGEDREESFRFLFETYHRRVRGYFARRPGSAEECLDLTQETFLRAYQGLPDFRGDAPFGAWLYSIARNLDRSRLERWRRRKNAATGAAEPAPAAPREPAQRGAPPDPVVAPEGLDNVLDDERRRLLREAISRLPEQRRRCIVLWVYHGLSYEQIAVALRLALGTVKAHLFQARQQLGELVEKGRRP